MKSDAPPLRQFDLLFTLAIAAALGFGFIGITGRAANPGLVTPVSFVCVGYRPAAGVALIVTAFFQRMVDADAIVEDKTFAMP